MSHHHYEDVIDTSIKKKNAEIEKLQREKENLLKEAEIKNTKAYSLSETLKKLKESKVEIDKQIIEVQKELNKLCTHEKIRTEERNYSGGYLDRAEYWTDYYCEICGVKVDEKVEYGGFA